jgi:hypothetical protein
MSPPVDPQAEDHMPTTPKVFRPAAVSSSWSRTTPGSARDSKAVVSLSGTLWKTLSAMHAGSPLTIPPPPATPTPLRTKPTQQESARAKPLHAGTEKAKGAANGPVSTARKKELTHNFPPALITTPSLSQAHYLKKASRGLSTTTKNTEVPSWQSG